MKTKQTTHLIGKGGVGLVMFHLARLNHEFMPTSDSSHCGDLWAEFDGKREAIEVKTSTNGFWTVRLNQADRVEKFAFVNLKSAGCWLISKDRILAEHRESTQRESGFFRVNTRIVETIADTALHRSAPSPVLALPKPKRPAHITGKWTVVRKRLASGEEKVYRYPR